MNNVRRRRRRKRRLNPEFIRAWLVLLTLIACIGGGLYALTHMRTSVSAKWAEPINTNSPAEHELVASPDYRADEEAALVGDSEPEVLRIDCQAMLDNVDLAIPQGKLYNRDWIMQFGAQIDNITFAYDAMQEHLPEQVHRMQQAYAAMYHLCFVATSDESNEKIPLMLAKTTTAEIGALDDAHAFSTARAEQAAVVWCVLNRVSYDYPRLFTNGTPAEMSEAIWRTTKSPNQFAYSYYTVAYDGHEALAEDVIIRWVLEGYGLLEDVGRTLPVNYRFFHALGDGWHNRFRTTFDGGSNCEYWYWTLPDPYVR
jgi:hypothetical protein